MICFAFRVNRLCEMSCDIRYFYGSKEDIHFCTVDFATRPVAMKSLECTGFDTLVYPARIQDDLSFFAYILSVKVLAGFFMRVD
jgi:hypothetical protein